MRWETEQVRKLIEKYARYIAIGSRNGDNNTENLILMPAPAGHVLWVYGFSVESEIFFPSDTNVDMVVVTDGIDNNSIDSNGIDSDGGLHSPSMATSIMYGQVCATLRQAGFDVVRSMDPYF